MAKERKWKSVMMRDDTHMKLLELSELTKHSMAEILDSMVSYEWNRRLGNIPVDNPYLQPPPGIKTYKSRV